MKKISTDDKNNAKLPSMQKVQFVSDSLLESTKKEVSQDSKAAPPKSSGGLFDEDEEEDDLFASVKTEKKSESKKGNSV